MKQTVDKQRNQLKALEKEVAQKTADVDAVSISQSSLNNISVSQTAIWTFTARGKFTGSWSNFAGNLTLRSELSALLSFANIWVVVTVCNTIGLHSQLGLKATASKFHLFD